MLRLGIGELIVVFLIILLLFGASKLPEIARALGRAVKEFGKAAKEIKDNLEDSDEAG